LFISVDLADDAAGDPVERLRVAIVVADIAVDGADEIAHAAERTAADAFARNFGEPAFDLIQPRAARGREYVVAHSSLCRIFAPDKTESGRELGKGRVIRPECQNLTKKRP
jgi:hypothetical protein